MIPKDPEITAELATLTATGRTTGDYRVYDK
jgi:hypothetical protein